MITVRAVSFLLCAGTLVAGCASAPPPVVSPPVPAPLTFEQKMTWMLTLEDQRVLESAEVPAPPPPLPAPAVGRGRGSLTVAMPPPPPRPSLLTLLTDRESRVRRRAALAVGRTRVSAGVEPLLPLLAGDAESEVRQMAAFALGLLGESRAAAPLTTALNDPDPHVQGRAAEALGTLSHKAAATPIAAMMAAHIKTGALGGIAADDLEYPKAPQVEAVRLGIYALVRLSAYEALASVLLDGEGRPVSRWWPVAYAFRRINDPRAGAPLLALLSGDGTFTRAFAARGLGVVKASAATSPLTMLAGNEREVANVRVEAIRALGDLGAQGAAPTLITVATVSSEPALRLEAVTTLGTLRAPEAGELMVDLITDPWPPLRAAAWTALARIDPDTLLSAMSGVDLDREWSVRAARATALGLLDGERARAGLTELAKDADVRVLPAVFTAMVAAKVPGAEATLIAQLSATDPYVRQAAASGLARLQASGAVPALVKAFDASMNDPTYVARAAVLAALVDLDRAAARPVLTRALADREWAIRVRAAALLGTLEEGTRGPSAATIRPVPVGGPEELRETASLVDPAVSPQLFVDTSQGTIQIELAVLDAPRTVANLVSLVRRGFFNGSAFHRVVPNFVVQDGDPRGDGEGGPGYTIRDEINQQPYLRGTIGMALDWEDTGGSQFFITHAPQPHLDGRYTVFGRVTDGIDVIDRLRQWDVIRSMRIWDGATWIGVTP